MIKIADDIIEEILFTFFFGLKFSTHTHGTSHSCYDNDDCGQQFRHLREGIRKYFIDDD